MFCHFFSPNTNYAQGSSKWRQMNRGREASTWKSALEISSRRFTQPLEQSSPSSEPTFAFWNIEAVAFTDLLDLSAPSTLRSTSWSSVTMKGSSYSLRVMKNAKQFQKPPPMPTLQASSLSIGPSPDTPTRVSKHAIAQMWPVEKSRILRKPEVLHKPRDSDVSSCNSIHATLPDYRTLSWREEIPTRERGWGQGITSRLQIAIATEWKISSSLDLITERGPYRMGESLGPRSHWTSHLITGCAKNKRRKGKWRNRGNRPG